MQKLEIVLSAMLGAAAISGCGDVTVNQPARRVIIEEKKEAPVVIEKTIVEKPVIIEKPVVDKPVVVEKKTVERPVIVIEKR